MTNIPASKNIAVYLDHPSPRPIKKEIFENIIESARKNGIYRIYYSGSIRNLETLGLVAKLKGISIYYVFDILNSNNYFFELLEESELYPTEDVFGNKDWYPRDPVSKRPGE